MDTPGPFEKKSDASLLLRHAGRADWTEKQKEEWLTSIQLLHDRHDLDSRSLSRALRAISALNASPANKVEKIFGSYAFIEGWAHYPEKMMLDEGFGSPTKADPSEEEQKVRAANIAWHRPMKRCSGFAGCVSRSRCTPRISVVDEATKFFHENCYYEEKPSHS